MAKRHRSSLISVLSLLSLAVLGCGKLGELTKTRDPKFADAKRITEEVLKRDVLADPPSPGAIVVRQLARLDPETASLQKTVEDLERSALKELTAKVTEKYKLEKPKTISALPVNYQNTRQPVFALVTGDPPAMLAMLQGQTIAAPQVGVSPNDVALLMVFTSVFADYVGDAMSNKGDLVFKDQKSKGDSFANITVEVGKGDAGATKFGFKMNVRGHEGKRSLDSDLEAMVNGVRCPDVNGSVYFDVSIKISGKSGESSYIQEAKAKVIAKVNDEADITSSEMKVNQGIQESVGGRNTYIETEFEITDNSGTVTGTPPRIVRSSQDQGPHAQELANSGYVAGMQAGASALAMAEAMWKNAGCITLHAKSPGGVEVNSVTEVPVDVKHKYEGGNVPSKVLVALSGETSVTPKQIDQTPGKLSYTAPPEKNKSATIKLEARSKRGRAKLDLNATTGGNAYRISGNIDEASMSGTTCDSSQPFSIGGTLQFQFKPTSATTGTYTYRGPYSATGSGPYIINGDGTMKLDGTGCIMGGNCATYSHSWTATPIDPASCGKDN